MLQVMLAIEIVIAIALVGVILLQRSEGGALGMGGGGSGSGFGGFLSARGAANVLTRATAFLAVAFIGVALAMAVMAGGRGDGTSVFDDDSLATPPAQTDELGDEDLLVPLEGFGGEGDDLPPADEPAEDEPSDDGSGE